LNLKDSIYWLFLTFTFSRGWALIAYSKQHPLYRALKELGKIPKTLFILKYIDDLEFRQAIEKQLNKVEGSNKFSKAVSFGPQP
jgi:TnpA family transposase